MVQSLTLNEAYSKSCLQLFIAAFLFCWENAKMMEPYEETCYLWTRSEFRFRYHENGTVSDRYESNSCRVSDRREARPVWVHF